MLLVDRRLTHGVEEVKRASVTHPFAILTCFFTFLRIPSMEATLTSTVLQLEGLHSFEGVDLRKYRSLEALPPLTRCE